LHGRVDVHRFPKFSAIAQRTLARDASRRALEREGLLSRVLAAQGSVRATT